MNYFEMRQARTWAMYTLNNLENIEIILDANNINDSEKWFLMHDIPQRDGGVTLAEWRGSQETNGMISFVNGDKIEKSLHIFNFTNDTSLYASMYDTNGNMFIPMCLIIWDRKRPHVTNEGYAPGRCPPTCEIPRRVLNVL